MVLTLILLLPFLGSFALLLLPRDQRHVLHYTALGISLAPLALSVLLLFLFPYGEPGFHCGVIQSWIPSLGIDFRLGLDGMSLVMVVLTAFLTTLSIPASFSYIHKREKEFYFFLLLLETGMLGTFMALDLFVFYLFWELMLVPMYFIIGVWGGEKRIYASIKFFLYTAFGSALLLLVIFYLYFQAGYQLGLAPSFNFENFTALTLTKTTQTWLFWGFILAFLIKIPLFPFHTWLPYAHTEAPTAGSVILAGILLKTGVYGILRFAVPIFPQAVVAFTPWLMALALIGIVYGAMIAMIQRDVKRLVAYSSVSHMGMILAGIFAWNVQGLQGGIIQMINHGLSTGALFLIVGIIYERRHTRQIEEFGGLAKVMPVYAAFFMIFTLSSIGLPGLNGFIGEFLILVGLMGVSIPWAVIASLGLILGAAYMLRLYKEMMFGPLTNKANAALPDLNRREFYILLPIAILCFIIGLYPAPLQKTLEPSVEQIQAYVQPYLEPSEWKPFPTDPPKAE
ncbi:MAG: NADH-quinone oxidoreductase subunit M [bacterium]|jgi:NADH-quinone oxidoreductase subunit M|nr:NADH-quinone oxidoreductase subunit M [bacterium]